MRDWIESHPFAFSALLLSPFLLVFLITPASLIYNYHLSELGRLGSSIDVGAPYARVRALFDRYCDKQRSSIALECVAGTGGEYQTDQPLKVLAIYDRTIFGQVKLEIAFDRADRVAEARFIGD